jgi:hypothetical protein
MQHETQCTPSWTVYLGTTKSKWPTKLKTRQPLLFYRGTFCYKIMLFGLKNTRATYQRAMVTLFHNMMHKKIEVYVEDMIAKSKKGEDHCQI